MLTLSSAIWDGIESMDRLGYQIQGEIQTTFEEGVISGLAIFLIDVTGPKEMMGVMNAETFSAGMRVANRKFRTGDYQSSLMHVEVSYVRCLFLSLSLRYKMYCTLFHATPQTPNRVGE